MNDQDMKTNLIRVVRKAIERENLTFNSYVRLAQTAESRETQALFQQLAEEERKHRILLANEVKTMENLLFKPVVDNHIRRQSVRYHIPESPEIRSINDIPGADVSFVMLPTGFLGGDTFESFVLRKNGKAPVLALLLLDVMGHGLEASPLKAQAKDLWGT